MCEQKRITRWGKPIQSETILKGGDPLVTLMPKTIEPGVNRQIEVIFEDSHLIVLNKPAPLPMHPGGRFNRNTLSHFIKLAFPKETIHPAHRLDANTSGLVVCAKSKTMADQLRQLFEARTVKKLYLAGLQAKPTTDHFECRIPISSGPTVAGGRQLDESGQAAHTIFRVRKSTSQPVIVEAEPKTGRTNQIRIHLWGLGYPICHDPLYLPNQKLGSAQTLPPGVPQMQLHAKRYQFKHPATKAMVDLETADPNWL